MKLLIEMKIDDNIAEKTGYSTEEFASLSKSVLKSYWYDEGIKLKDNENEEDYELNDTAIINTYF